MNTPAPQTSSPVNRVVLWCVGLFAALHIVTIRVPSVWTWSVDYFSDVSGMLTAALAAVVALSIVPFVGDGVDRLVAAISRTRHANPIALSILGLLFFGLRSRALAYGDGYTVAGYFADGAFPKLAAQLLTHPLDLGVHWVVHRIVVGPAGGTVQTTFALMSAVAGVFAVWAVVRISRALGGDPSHRRLIICGALASGTTALWFGHVEVYSLAAAASAWALAFALESFRLAARMRWAWAAWIIACALHMVSLVIGPALLYAQWVRGSSDASSRRLRPWAALSGGLLICGLGAAVASMFSDTHIFVRWWPSAQFGYAAFSPAHVSDVINLILFLSPLGVIGLVVWVFARRWPAPSAAVGKSVDPGRTVLAVAAAGGFCFAFWIDPMLGGFRDWDLMAQLGIPLSLWGATVVIGRPRRRIENRTWVAVAALALLHVGGFVATTRSEVGAALRVDRLVRDDVHYSDDFQRAERRLSWSRILDDRLGLYDLAIEHLRFRAALTADDPNSWANLGSAYRHAGQDDSAAACLQRAIDIDSSRAEWNRNLGLLWFELGEMARAEPPLRRVCRDGNALYSDLVRYGAVLQSLGRFDDADSVYSRAVRSAPEEYNAYAAWGGLAQRRGDTARAIALYRESIARGATVEDPYRLLTHLYQLQGRAGQALATAQSWEQTFPASAAAPFFMGTVYIVSEQYDSANAALQRAHERIPDNVLAMYYLATTYRHLGQPERSGELVRRATQIDSTFALPYLELVYLAADAGDTAGAATAAREYVRRAPDQAGMEYLQQFLDYAP